MNYESNSADPDDEALFDNLQNVITADVHDRVDAGNESFNHNQVQLLNGAANGVVGSVLTIPVGTGDKISAEVYAKYLAPTGTNNPAAEIGNLVIGAITGTTGTGIYEGAITSGYGSGGTVTSLINANASSTEPMAFINLLFLPDDVTGSIATDHFAFKQVTSASSNNQAILALDQPYEAPESGYVVVYLSNESAQLTEVYFDDLRVTVEEHPVIQTADYYAFGLQHDGGYERVTAKENKFLNTGKERITDLDLNWDDFGARFYDPAIARWTTLDQKAYRGYQFSPYNYSFNNPVRYVDPDGNWPWESKTVRQARKFARATGGKFDKNSRGTRRRTGQSATVNINGTTTGSLVRKNLFGVYGTENLTSDQIDRANLVGFNEGTNYGFLFERPEYMLANVAVGLNGLSRIALAIPGLQSLFMNSDGKIDVKALSDYLLKSSDNSKNEKHGDSSALDKVQEQISGLEAQLEGATKKEKKKIKKKIQNIRQNAQKKQKGEEHSKTNKK